MEFWMTFPSYWEFHHPNSQSPSFFRGVGWNQQPVVFWYQWGLSTHQLSLSHFFAGYLADWPCFWPCFFLHLNWYQPGLCLCSTNSAEVFYLLLCLWLAMCSGPVVPIFTVKGKQETTNDTWHCSSHWRSGFPHNHIYLIYIYIMYYIYINIPLNVLRWTSWGGSPNSRGVSP